MTEHFNSDDLVPELEFLLNRPLTSDEHSTLTLDIADVDANYGGYYGISYYCEVMERMRVRYGWDYEQLLRERELQRSTT